MRLLSLFCLSGVLLFGCKSSKTEQQSANYEQTPEQTVDKIMTSYDSNSDGSLDASELERCPSLKTLLRSMNKGPNGQIKQGELLERIKTINAASIKMPSVPCRVTMNGVPLEGATITFTSENFQGSPVVVSGTTGPDGQAQIGGSDGVLSGFYQISISKQSSGAEMVPPKYNSATTLGVEISNQGFGRGGTLDLPLSSN